MNYVNIDHIPLEALHQVQDEGNQPNQQQQVTVVLCQNFGASKSEWDGVVPRLLRGGYRVIRYENMGSPGLPPAIYHNYYTQRIVLSGQSILPWPLFPFAWDLVAILENRGVQNCVFVGHSLACMIGVLAANLRPHLFSRLILINPTPKYLDDPQSGCIGGFTEAMRDAIIEVFAHNETVSNTGRGERRLARHIRIRGAREEADKNRARHMAAPLFALDDSVARHLVTHMFDDMDGRNDLARLMHPCFLMQSVQDHVVPSPTTEFIMQTLQRPDRADIPTQLTYHANWIRHHYPHTSSPAGVAQAIVEFINQN